MKTMMSPWRQQYIDSFKDEKKDIESGCFICDAINSVNEDEAKLIAGRTAHSIIIMNRYPYNSGHIMIAPSRHIASFEELSTEEITELMQSAQKLTKILSDIYKPEGFNIGMNIGRIAGAGVPGHIHLHLVPRWSGDTNFMPVLADTKVVSEDIAKARASIAEAFAK